ncbi:MAG TPA: response regulator [Pirellulales bacterium]|nr:response regulator [Pirellulales bacterium]
MADTPVDILLVEDSPDDVELTLRTLNKHLVTVRIEVVRDGAEALDYLLCTGPHANRSIDLKPGLVLLDLKLPKLSGLEVLRAIKSDPRTRTIPIVVLTSSSEDRDIAEAYQFGVNSYIVKPVDFQQFDEAIRQVGLYWLLLNYRPGK